MLNVTGKYFLPLLFNYVTSEFRYCQNIGKGQYHRILITFALMQTGQYVARIGVQTPVHACEHRRRCALECMANPNCPPLILNKSLFSAKGNSWHCFVPSFPLPFLPRQQQDCCCQVCLCSHACVGQQPIYTYIRLDKTYRLTDSHTVVCVCLKNGIHVVY